MMPLDVQELLKQEESALNCTRLISVQCLQVKKNADLLWTKIITDIVSRIILALLLRVRLPILSSGRH